MTQFDYQQRYNNVQMNKSTQLANLIVDARYLAKHLKPIAWGIKDKGLEKIHEMIVRACCTLYLSHISIEDFNAVLESSLEYFNAGLFDTSRNMMQPSVDKGKYIVGGWIDSPDNGTDAGERIKIYTFDNIGDGESCMAMLQAAGEELEKLYSQL